jgi:hypothetical protein
LTKTEKPSARRGPKQIEAEAKLMRKRAEADGATGGVKPERGVFEDDEAGQQETARPNKFTFITAADLEAMELPPLEWIVDGLIPRVLVSSVVAASGAGKTWLALDLLRACASGGMFLGSYAALKCRVGMFDAEDGYIGLKRRWEQLRDGMGALPADCIMPRLLSDIGAFDIMNPEESADLEAAMRNLDALIVDSLSQSHGKQESDNSEMKLVMQQWESLSRRTGCIVILVHHSGWGAPERGRGGTVIRDRVQAELNLTVDAGSGVTRISLNKCKFDVLRPNVATMRIDGNRKTPVQLVFGEAAIEPTDAQRDALRRYVLEQLRGVQMLQQDLVDGVVKQKIAGRTTAHEILVSLANEGAIVRTKAGKGFLCALP